MLDRIMKIIVIFYNWSMNFINMKFIVPCMKYIIAFLSKRIMEKNGEKYDIPPSDNSVKDWKIKALADFQSWLDDLPEIPSPIQGTITDSCDLYTLLSEFSALRQEIRIQNKEQKKTIRSLNSFIETYSQILNVFRSLNNNLLVYDKKVQKLIEKYNENLSSITGQYEENIRKEIEKRTIYPFLDVRDALVRGYNAGTELSGFKNFFMPKIKKIKSIRKGYEMAIHRFDRSLDQVGVHPVETLGKPFDAVTMRALDEAAVPGMEKGIVVEELSGGFIRNDEVIKTAEVIVSK